MDVAGVRPPVDAPAPPREDAARDLRSGARAPELRGGPPDLAHPSQSRRCRAGLAFGTPAHSSRDGAGACPRGDHRAPPGGRVRLRGLGPDRQHHLVLYARRRWGAGRRCRGTGVLPVGRGIRGQAAADRRPAASGRIHLVGLRPAGPSEGCARRRGGVRPDAWVLGRARSDGRLSPCVSHALHAGAHPVDAGVEHLVVHDAAQPPRTRRRASQRRQHRPHVQASVDAVVRRSDAGGARLPPAASRPGGSVGDIGVHGLRVLHAPGVHSRAVPVSAVRLARARAACPPPLAAALCAAQRQLLSQSVRGGALGQRPGRPLG